MYSKTCLKRPLKNDTKNWVSIPIIAKCRSKVLQNAPIQKYCRMLQWEHSAILLTSIKLQLSIKSLDLSIFKWSFKTGFTVLFIGQYALKFQSCVYHIVKPVFKT